MTAKGETALIDVPIRSQLSALLFCEFNFYTICAEVAFFTSTQLAPKWFFNFCPTWTEVGFLTSTQLGRKSVFYSRQVVGKLIFKILSNLGRIIFLKFFRKTLLKMPFSSATTGRDFFFGHSPKRQFHRLPFEKDYGQKAFLAGYHLRDKWPSI